MSSKFWNEDIQSIVYVVITLTVLTIATIGIISLYKNIPFIDSWNYVYNFEVKIYVVIIFIVLFLMLKVVYKTFKKDSIEDKKIQLKKFDSKIDYENNIKFTWIIQFKAGRPVPFISILKIFCLKHEIPLLLLNELCPNSDCENSKSQLNYNKIHNEITSEVYDKWDKLNS